MENREGLEQQLKDLEAQKVALFDGGNADQNEVARLNGEIKTVQQQLSAIETQEIAESYQTTVKPCIINVSGTDVNLRDYIESDANHRVVAIAFDTKIYELNYAITEQAKRFDIERQQFRDQLTNADAAADAKYNELYEQFHNVKNERDDFERKHQAATSEIESLKQQLEVANSRVEAPKQTNLDGNLAEAMRKANEAKRAIYNVVKDTAGINYTAKFVDTDEEFTDKVIYIGKFRVLAEEEAARFRSELEAAEAARQAELESIPEAVEPVEVEVAIPVPTFPIEVPDAHTADRLVGDFELSESVPDDGSGVVTREEFEALKQRVDALTNLSEVVVTDIEQLKAVA